MPDVASDKEHSASSTASPKTTAKSIKNGIQCQITCLDSTVFNIVIEKDAKGSDLLDKVVEHLNVVEKEYFGLQYIKANKTEKYWLDPTKGVKKQLKNGIPHFEFAVKFFEPSPRDIKTDYTRYLMCLQLREDIATGKLTSSFIAQANLGAYYVQAEEGDYDACKEGYLDGFVFAPNQTPELLEKIRSMHQSLRGMNPEEADLRYIETARGLILYGVDCHPAMDCEIQYVILGISFAGIHVYKDNTTINTFRWPTIEDVAYKGRNFTIRCRPGEFGDLLTTLVYKLENEKAAKNCWKSCVEYHTFYRLKTPDPPASKGERMMKLGSKFRYSDRTLYQLRKERPGSEKQGQGSPEKFQRVPSKHADRSRGQPTEHVLHVVDKEEDPNRKRPLDNGEEEAQSPVSPPSHVYRPNEKKAYRDDKKAPLMEEESMATMTPEEREMYRQKMAKQIQKTTTTTTTTVLVIKNEGDEEGTQLEQSPIAKELEEQALMSKGVSVEGGSRPPRVTELEDEEEEEEKRKKEKEKEEEEERREREIQMQRLELARIEKERLEKERKEKERREQERVNGDKRYIVGGYIAGERPRRTHDLKQSEQDVIDVNYSVVVEGAAATPIQNEEEEEEEELEFLAFTAATPSTEEVKTAKRKTMDFDEEYDRGEVRRLEDEFNKPGVATTTRTVTTTTTYKVRSDDDYQGRPESPTLLGSGATPYYTDSNTLPSRRPPPPPVAPKRYSSGDRLDDRKDEGYSKLITREELVRSYSPAGTLEAEGELERDTQPEVRTSLKDDLNLEHEQGERGFVLESVRKNEEIIDNISTQVEADGHPQVEPDELPPRPPPPVSEVSTKTVLITAEAGSPTLVRKYNAPEVKTVLFKVENNQLQPVEAGADDSDDFPSPPPEIEESENGVVLTRTVTIEGSAQPQASRTEVIKTTTMPAEIITKTITIQGDGKPLTAQELSEIMALQSGPAGNFSPTEVSTQTFTTTQQVRRVQKIDKVVTEKKVITADGTTTEICTGDPDTDAAIAKALEEARSAGADSTVTEVVVTKSDDFDSEV